METMTVVYIYIIQNNYPGKIEDVIQSFLLGKRTSPTPGDFCCLGDELFFTKCVGINRGDFDGVTVCD